MPAISASPCYHEFRAGGLFHSLAGIRKAQCLSSYAPTHPIKQGIGLAMPLHPQMKA